MVPVFLLAAASAQVGFQKTDYATGTNPVKLVTADFNKDGIPDLATANAQGNSVSILLGKSDGTFAAHVDYPVGVQPSALAVADFNKDGKLDLVVANSKDNTVSILLGNGDGTFTAQTAMAAGTNPQGVAVGDFNKDGNPDIAIADAGDHAVLILLGTGTGVFTPGQQMQLATSSQGFPSPPTDIAVADFNGDGILDLAISACCNGPDVSWGELHLATGKGDGTFTDQILSTYPGSYSILAADVNRDGHPDLVDPYEGCHTPCAGVDVRLNSGNGSFTQTNSGGVSTLQYGAPSGVSVADIDGDGNPDIVVPFTAGEDESSFGKNFDKVLVLLGKGDGTFPTQLDFAIGPQAEPASPVVADFNHDGKLDIAVVDSRTNSVSVLLNVSGTPAAAQDFAFTVSPASQTVAAGKTGYYSAYAEAIDGSLPALTVTCSGLPQGAACSTQYVTGSPIADGTLNITTTARTTGALKHESPFGSPFTWFAVILPLGLVTTASGKRKLGLYIAVVAIVALACFQIGCGGATNASTSGATSTTAGSASSGTNGSSGSSTGTSSGTTGSGSSGTSTGTGSGTATGSGSGSGTTGGSGSGTGTGTGSGTGSGGSGTGTGGSGNGSGSGSGGSTSSGTPAGTYTVTVKAAGANGITHTATVTLVVQ